MCFATIDKMPCSMVAIYFDIFSLGGIYIAVKLQHIIGYVWVALVLFSQSNYFAYRHVLFPTVYHITAAYIVNVLILAFMFPCRQCVSFRSTYFVYIYCHKIAYHTPNSLSLLFYGSYIINPHVKKQNKKNFSNLWLFLDSCYLYASQSFAPRNKRLHKNIN